MKQKTFRLNTFIFNILRLSLFLALALFTSCILCSKAYAEPFDEQSFEFLIRGDVEAVIKNIEKEKDFNWQEGKIDLGKRNSEYYAIALMVMGDFERAEKFLEKARKRHPKSLELEKIERDLSFFKFNLDNELLGYSKLEESQISLIKTLPQYLTIKEIIGKKEKLGEEVQAASKLRLKTLKDKLLELISYTNNRTPYLPSKLDYLLEMGEYEEASHEALEILNRYSEKLFPKTLDFYELALAHRSLGIINYRTKKNKKEAEKHYRVAKFNIAKMKSLWLKEDIISDGIIQRRHTEFGYVLPQWLLSLRNQYEEEYVLLATEIQADAQVD